MEYVDKKKNQKILEWIFIAFFVIVYPMLVSMYPLVPPLFGIAGLIIIYNINTNLIYPLTGFIKYFLSILFLANPS